MGEKYDKCSKKVVPYFKMFGCRVTALVFPTATKVTSVGHKTFAVHASVLYLATVPLE